MTFTIPGVPVAKPRMTKRDKWKKRPCCVAYFDYRDRVREATRGQYVNQLPDQLTARFFLPMPASWSAKAKAFLKGAPHTVKPDADNLMKGLKDALFAKDETVWNETTIKRWDDGHGARAEVTIT